MPSTGAGLLHPAVRTLPLGVRPVEYPGDHDDEDGGRGRPEKDVQGRCGPAPENGVALRLEPEQAEQEHDPDGGYHEPRISTPPGPGLVASAINRPRGRAARIAGASNVAASAAGTAIGVSPSAKPDSMTLTP